MPAAALAVLLLPLLLEAGPVKRAPGVALPALNALQPVTVIQPGIWPAAVAAVPVVTGVATSLNAAVAAAAPAQAKSETSVLWWNIEHGKTNDRLPGDPLGKNLEALASAPDSPDIIVLGEYRHGALSAATREALGRRYDSMLIPYNRASGSLGMMVLHDRALRARLESARMLDWAPLDAQDKTGYRDKWGSFWHESWLFWRPYVRLRFEKQDGASIHLVPVHLAQPFSPLRDRWGGLLGPIVAGFQAFLGRNNPLFYQATRLRRALAEDMGARLGDEPLLMIGDFNASSWAPSLRLFKSALKNAFARAQSTWPAATGAPVEGFYPSMQLDHAYASPALWVQSASVLPLSGSDHYPIRVSVKPQPPRRTPPPRLRGKRALLLALTAAGAASAAATFTSRPERGPGTVVVDERGHPRGDIATPSGNYESVDIRTGK